MTGAPKTGTAGGLTTIEASLATVGVNPGPVGVTGGGSERTAPPPPPPPQAASASAMQAGNNARANDIAGDRRVL